MFIKLEVKNHYDNSVSTFWINQFGKLTTLNLKEHKTFKTWKFQTLFFYKENNLFHFSENFDKNISDNKKLLYVFNFNFYFEEEVFKDLFSHLLELVPISLIFKIILENNNQFWNFSLNDIIKSFNFFNQYQKIFKYNYYEENFNKLNTVFNLLKCIKNPLNKEKFFESLNNENTFVTFFNKIKKYNLNFLFNKEINYLEFLIIDEIETFWNYEHQNLSIEIFDEVLFEEMGLINNFISHYKFPTIEKINWELEREWNSFYLKIYECFDKKEMESIFIKDENHFWKILFNLIDNDKNKTDSLFYYLYKVFEEKHFINILTFFNNINWEVFFQNNNNNSLSNIMEKTLKGEFLSFFKNHPKKFLKVFKN